jgi:hypothetical protein
MVAVRRTVGLLDMLHPRKMAGHSIVVRNGQVWPRWASHEKGADVTSRRLCIDISHRAGVRRESSLDLIRRLGARLMFGRRKQWKTGDTALG